MTPMAWLDDIGKPAWIGLMVLSFVLFWPLGLVLLGFLVGSGRMTCWSHNGTNRWQRRMERMQRGMERMQRGMDRMHDATRRWGSGTNNASASSSGNRAFDEYRAETLRRLEEEQQEFLDFLDRLRHARDKAEFDQFMAERRRPPQSPAPQPEG